MHNIIKFVADYCQCMLITYSNFKRDVAEITRTKLMGKYSMVNATASIEICKDTKKASVSKTIVWI